MGVGATFAEAYAKAQLGAGDEIPVSGTAFVSVRERDQPGVVEVARELHALGFRLVSTRGTAALIAAAGIPVEVVNKVKEGRPHIVDMIKNGQIDLIVNTTEGRKAIADSAAIRASARARALITPPRSRAAMRCARRCATGRRARCAACKSCMRGWCSEPGADDGSRRRAVARRAGTSEAG